LANNLSSAWQNNTIDRAEDMPWEQGNMPRGRLNEYSGRAQKQPTECIENAGSMANVQRCAAAFTGIGRCMHRSNMNSCMPSIAVTCSKITLSAHIITYQANLCMLVHGGTDLRWIILLLSSPTSVTRVQPHSNWDIISVSLLGSFYHV
jgi:hypothetical protein